MGRTQVWLSLAVLAGALALGLSLVPASVDADEKRGIKWVTNLDEARDKARKEGKPLLVVFR